MGHLFTFIQSSQGELAALSTAILWAVACVIYDQVGQKISPLLLNLIKAAIASVLLGITILVLSGLNLDSLSFLLGNQKLTDISSDAIFLLAVSGVIGLSLGDTAYFASLNRLGARRTLLISTLAAPMTAILASVFLAESLTLSTASGIWLTVLGVGWVITERVPGTTQNTTHLLEGIGFGFLASLCQAAGVLLSRAAFTYNDISPVWSTFLRLVAGTLVLGIWLWIQPQSWQTEIKVLRSKRVLTLTFIATFLGTYLAICLQQTALKFTDAGIAQALVSTSPLFILPMAMALGEKVSFRAFGGVIIAIIGVVILFNRG